MYKITDSSLLCFFLYRWTIGASDLQILGEFSIGVVGGVSDETEGADMEELLLSGMVTKLETLGYRKQPKANPVDWLRLREFKRP